MSQEIATSPTSQTTKSEDEAEAGLMTKEAPAEAGTNVTDEETGGEKEEAEAPASNRVDLEKMKDSVFYLYPDRGTRLSGFWLLMILSSIIATSGVVGDSGATVIGAMIVAPLMTPILGTMLGIVVCDARNLMVCFTLVLTGAGSAILVGYLFGLAIDDDVIAAENNSQVAGRVQPKLPDLIGALATGAVGSVALVRQDIASTMPGVAISIALVPPLCVVGLTLSSGAGHDAAGAMLLFATNFACIMVMGILVMMIYRVPWMVGGISRREKYVQRTLGLIIVALLAIVAIPLGITSKQLSDTYAIADCLKSAINEWGDPNGWYVTYIVTTTQLGKYLATVTVAGEPPFPNATDFPSEPNYCGADMVDLRFVPVKTMEF